MRVVMALCLACSAGAFPGLAVAQGASAGRRPAAAPTTSGSRASTTDVNAAARLAADERQRRWDERMRRVTNSMCKGC